MDASASRLDYGIRPPAYRLPDATRVGPVVLQVADLARSLRYYDQVLGLRQLQHGDGEAVLGAYEDDTPLVRLRELAGAAPVPRRGRLGLYHYAILLPDRPALGRFVAHLSDIGAYAGMSDHFVSEAVYLTDPDGLGIEVYADRPRDSWHVSDRQLFMQTEPLDVHAVVSAAGGDAWTGMPAGTRMGHVHLYVGDLEQAASFYHNGLGLDKIVWSYPGALFLSAGGYHHHLGTNTWAAGAARAQEGDARLLEWTLVVPERSDAEAAARSVRDAGGAVDAARDSWTATDPWGTTLRLVPEGA
jgi:catechol 2,3-dioxygenase